MSWLLDHAKEEDKKRGPAYKSMVRRGKMTMARMKMHLKRWGYVVRLVTQGEKDQATSQPDRPTVLTATEIKEALAEARREQTLRKKYYEGKDDESKATNKKERKEAKEAKAKLVGIAKLIEFIEEQQRHKVGTQAKLFS